MRISEKMRTAFWSQVKVNDPDSCWNWVGTTTVTGCPKFTFRYNGGQTSTTARRFCFQDKIRKGLMSKYKFVQKSCNNQLCVNPYHLTLANAPHTGPSPGYHCIKVSPRTAAALLVLTKNDFKVSQACRLLGVRYDTGLRLVKRVAA